MRIAVSIVMLLCWSTGSRAQSAMSRDAGPRQVTATARALMALEDGWARGVVRRDTAMFRRLLDPRFVYTEDAVVMTKDELIRAIRDGDRVSSASNSDMIVHEHGGTAVVTGILRMQGTAKDGPFDRRYRFTDTWLRRNGSWRMIAAQDYLIPR
ncbi:MAG: nuclear transport factor 2 family protein [Gemmatimonadaceae bacterium]